MHKQKTFLSIAFTIVCLFQCSIFQVLKAFTKGRLQKVDFGGKFVSQYTESGTICFSRLQIVS